MIKWKPNEYEWALISAIEEAQKYCKGELEANYIDNGWYARDYIREFEQSFLIIENGYHEKPLISDETIQKYNVDVEMCFDYCDIYYVG